MKTEKVYDNGGECLGDMFVDLSKLQKDSVLAIYQIIYLDELALIHEKLISNNTQKKAPN